MKVHGDDGWGKIPSYLDIVLPITLDILDILDIKITFLLWAGCCYRKNHKILRSIVERGMKCNHSFHTSHG
jgi:hypothetical protein